VLAPIFGRSWHTAALLALLLAALSFSLQGWVGLSLSDEGYLWYGMQRVLAGDMPIRDFDAYDPARYYWLAAVSKIWGDDGVIAMRAGIASMQAVALFVAIVLIARDAKERDAVFLLVAAVILVLWMLPRHKQIDITYSVLTLGTIALLLQRPNGARWLLLGIVVGLAAVAGRNHGVYAVFGSLLALGYLALRCHGASPLYRNLALWIAGIVLGYTPILALLMLVPGFAATFWDGVRYLFEFGGTNLPLPVPWPWLENGDLSPYDRFREALVGVWFVAVLGFAVMGTAALMVLRLRTRVVLPVLAASAFVALPYAHHAFSRADIWHLAQGIFPALIGFIVLVGKTPRRTRRALVALLLAGTAVVMLPVQPVWECRRADCVDVQIGADKLQLAPAAANHVSFFGRLVDDHAGHNRTFMTVPLFPGAYALFRRQAPTWEIYPLRPRGDAFERAEIARIAAAQPSFVAIFDHPLDGRDELRFRNTHPLVYRYILDNYRPIATQGAAPAFEVFVPPAAPAQDHAP
jgi:hypothetical protein